MGTLWTRPGISGSTVTIYLHPSRYTREVLQQNETFTVSFFSSECRNASVFASVMKSAAYTPYDYMLEVLERERYMDIVA